MIIYKNFGYRLVKEIRISSKPSTKLREIIFIPLKMVDTHKHYLFLKLKKMT